ncbi:MAG: hypothetical protein AcusKO_18390 [Acuticoccus sp.]
MRQQGRWFERTVGLADDRLTFGLSPFAVPMAHEAPEGAVREISPAGEAMAGAIGGALAAHGKGAALIIDYGYKDVIGGETFQAVRRHKSVDVLERPGEVDLSAHVDFGALGAAAAKAGAQVRGPVGQGAFLVALGLLQRAGQLGAGADGATQDSLRAAVHRLAGEGEGEMGALFKVLALMPDGIAAPPGF